MRCVLAVQPYRIGRYVDEREYRKCSSRNRLAAGFWPDRGWGSSQSQRTPIAYSINGGRLAAGDKSKSGKEKERWREDGLKRGYGRDGTH